MTKNHSRGFTLIELLVVISVIAILFSIGYPALIGALERAKVTKDMNNLRQIGLGLQTYLNDNDQVLPATLTWPGTTAMPVLYSKYISARRSFQSPFDKRSNPDTDNAPVSYSINTNMYASSPGINRNMSNVVSPASTIFMAPNYPLGTGDPANAASWTGTFTSGEPDLQVGGGGETKGTHFNGTKINALFCDYHVENMTFGPATTTGTFQNLGSSTDLLDKAHWDPTVQP
jgi:prepilin-type N-terminal cleavage/methylation domain-containing protein